MPREVVSAATSGESSGSSIGAGFCLAPQEYRTMTRRSKDIRRSYIRSRNRYNKNHRDTTADTTANTSTATTGSTAASSSVRRRPQHLIHERMNRLPSSEPIYLDLSATASPPPSPARTTTTATSTSTIANNNTTTTTSTSRSERIRKRLLAGKATCDSSGNDQSPVRTPTTPPSNNNKISSSSAPASPVPQEKSVTAAMEKTWWKGSPFAHKNSNNKTTINQAPTSTATTTTPKAPAEEIFYVGTEDAGSVMTGMSQQELLRKKARTESKKHRWFGGKKKKKKAIVNLPAGLLAKNNSQQGGGEEKFYSSSSMPSSTASPKVTPTRQSAAPTGSSSATSRNNTERRSAANKPPLPPPSQPLLSSSSSSANNNNNSGLWKISWAVDEKESDTTAESTLIDSLPPMVQKTPSMETPYSTVPQTWSAAMNETEGDSFLEGNPVVDDNCSIDEYSFPLLSTGALGGILDDATDQQPKSQQQPQTQHSELDRGLSSIPEIKERPSTISATSRSESSSRVRFSATAELSTIVAMDDEGVVTSVETDETGEQDSDLYRSTSYMSYQIDLDSPTSVADILHKSNTTYTPKPKTRRPKPRSSLSPVQSILRPGKYGDRNGNDMSGFNKAYVRAMSYWKASQILRNRRSSFEDDEPSMHDQDRGGINWMPAMAEEDKDLQALRFVDPSGVELSPIRESRSASVSEAESGEGWSEFEDSETMQRLNFIEAVAAVVIQTGYRRYCATRIVNALREDRARMQERNKGGGQENVTEQNSASPGRRTPLVETVMSEEMSESKASARNTEVPRSPRSPSGSVRTYDSKSPHVQSPPKPARHERPEIPRSPKTPPHTMQSKEAVTPQSHPGTPLHTSKQSDEAVTPQSQPRTPPHTSKQSDEAVTPQSHPTPGLNPYETLETPFDPKNKMWDQALLDEEMCYDDHEATPESAVEPKQLQADFQKTVMEPESVPKSQPEAGFHSLPAFAAPNKTRNFDPHPVSSPRSLREEHDREGRFPVLAEEVPVIVGNAPQPPSRAAAVTKSGESRDEGIPEHVQHMRKEAGESTTLSSKPSFADSVSFSEITMDKDCHFIEEPKRKSVSEYVQDMEADEQRKVVPDQVVHMEGQSVRIVASNVFEGVQQPKIAQERSRELPANKSKQEENVDHAGNDWRRSWLQSPQREPTGPSGFEKGSRNMSGKHVESVGNAFKKRGLPSPQRKHAKKEESSTSSYGDADSNIQESGASQTTNTSHTLFVEAAVKIQSVFRGFWVRDCINVDHYCAMVIQKAFRGYMCRVDFQYDRYRVIVAQSIWRRSIARSDVAHVLACVIILQAAIRGFLGRRVRKSHERDLVFVEQKKAAALTIQCSWRRYWCETCLIRTLVDVLISQSIVRGWLARQELKRLKAAKQGQRKDADESFETSDGNSDACGVEAIRVKSFDSGSTSTQKVSPESSPGRSSESTESSIPATPPKVIQRVTQKRTALEPPWSPSSSAKRMNDSKETKPGSSMLVMPIDDDDEDEPGQIPVVKRVSRETVVPRDGRPPMAPIRVKSSKLAEKYESGLRQAEQDRKDAQKKSVSRKKVQNIPPVDVEDNASALGSIADSEDTLGGASKGTPAVTTTSARDETDTIEETESSVAAEAREEARRKKIEEAKQIVEKMPEDHPYKGYYAAWADRGLFQPKVSPPAAGVVGGVDGTESGADTAKSDSVASVVDSEVHASKVNADAKPSGVEDIKNSEHVPHEESTGSQPDKSAAAEDGSLDPSPTEEASGSPVPPLPETAEVTSTKCKNNSTGSNSQDGRTSPDAVAKSSPVPESVVLRTPTEEICRTSSEDSSIITGPKQDEGKIDQKNESSGAVSPVAESEGESSVEASSHSDHTTQKQNGLKGTTFHYTLKSRTSPVTVSRQNVEEDEVSKYDPTTSVASSTKSDPTPSVASTTKSVVVYPEGFEPKPSRRKIVDRSCRSVNSEEKKDSESLPEINRSDSGSGQSTEQDTEGVDASSGVTNPEAEAVQSSSPKRDEKGERVFETEDPYFSAYVVWYNKGLLTWKPATSSQIIAVSGDKVVENEGSGEI